MLVIKKLVTPGKPKSGWAAWDAKHPEMHNRAKANFVGFKTREGMKPLDATDEFHRLHDAGSADNYIKSPRLGAKFTANRAERLDHIKHFENAYNHASFEVQKMEFANILKGGVGSGRYKKGSKAEQFEQSAAEHIKQANYHSRVAEHIGTGYEGNLHHKAANAHKDAAEAANKAASAVDSKKSNFDSESANGNYLSHKKHADKLSSDLDKSTEKYTDDDAKMHEEIKEVLSSIPEGKQKDNVNELLSRLEKRKQLASLRQELVGKAAKLEEVLKEQLAEFESILKGGVGSGRHSGDGYHNSHSAAMSAAHDMIKSKGYSISDENWQHHVAGKAKPSEGATNRYSIPMHKDGVETNKFAHIQVYNRGNDSANPYELNSYVDAGKPKVAKLEEVLKSQLAEFEEIMKGGVGSGRHASINHIHLKDVEHLEQVFTKMTDKGWITPDWLKDLRAHAESKVTGAKEPSSKGSDAQKVVPTLKEQLAEFESILKGTEGKHWKWHSNTGSQVANNIGASKGYAATHNDVVSRHVATHATSQAAEDSARSVHHQLTANGFNMTGSKQENLPWRNSTQMNYSHPDGTQVESMLNQAKDASTENSHGFSVYHSNTSTPAKSPDTVPEAAQGVNHPIDPTKVANTILAQYGGNKFRAMTGAHSFTASKEKGGALTFKLPKTAGATKGTKYVKTVHDPATDTYDVHMLGRNGDIKHSASGIYADQLQSHFKHHTGLHTYL